jgi:hypothetical protein
MKRGRTGKFEIVTIGDEKDRAFLQRPMPPDPLLILQGPIQTLLERALLALGRLDSVATLLPGTGLFLYAYLKILNEGMKPSWAGKEVQPLTLRSKAGWPGGAATRMQSGGW